MALQGSLLQRRKNPDIKRIRKKIPGNSEEIGVAETPTQTVPTTKQIINNRLIQQGQTPLNP